MSYVLALENCSKISEGLSVYELNYIIKGFIDRFFIPTVHQASSLAAVYLAAYMYLPKRNHLCNNNNNILNVNMR